MARRLAGLLGATVFAVGLPTGTASAADFPAACTGGAGDPASLVNAINVANANAGPDVVSLGQGCRYTLTGREDNDWYGLNSLPAISSDITIEGNGATIARSTDTMTTLRHRFFFVGADASDPSTPSYVTPGPGRLTLRDLTLENGVAQGGSANTGGAGAGMGGAIFNQGTLVLERTTLTSNRAEGGAAGFANGGSGGGGIGGTSSSTGDQQGGGFGGFGLPDPHPNAGMGGTGGSAKGGGGGAGFVQFENGFNGTADAMNNRIGGNGGAAVSGTGTGLGGARGGGLNGTSGFGGDGSGGGGGGTGSGTGGAGGAFGTGGPPGISLLGYGGGGGVGGGGGGGQGTGGGGAGGFGGGGGASADPTSVNGPGGDGGFGGGGAAGCTGCNPAGGFEGFGGGRGTTNAAGGGAGMGGAIFNMQGTVQIRNSTLTGNSAVGGAGTASNPGQGLGGALFNLSGSVAADDSTFAGNTGAQGGASLYNLVYDSVATRQAQMTLRDTIVSDTAGINLVSDNPVFTSAAFNRGTANADVSAFDLVRTMEQRVQGTITGSPLTADPLLGPLADNGGPTRTMAPSAGSPVIDAGSAFGLTTDQRGLSRPFDTAGVANAADGSDIGAVEVQPPPAVGAGGGAGGGTGAGTTPPATVATASRLTIAPRAFPAAARGPSARASAPRRTGAIVRFRLNVASPVRFTVQRAKPGRRVGRRCVVPTRSNRKRRRCTRFVTVRGSFTRTGKVGANKFRFTGRLRARKLALGSYRLIATPRAGGRNGRAARAAFRIVR